MMTIFLDQLPPGTEIEIWPSQIVPIDSPAGYMADCDEQLILEPSGAPVFSKRLDVLTDYLLAAGLVLKRDPVDA